MLRSSLVRVRVALVVGALLLAAFAAQRTLVPVLRKASAETALRLQSNDARARAIHANELITADADSRQLAKAKSLALGALGRDATVASAYQALGLLADLAGERALASRLLRQSDLTSRRELPTQLWLIQESVRVNNVADALRHYDVGLRAHPEAAQILFPVLVTAIEDNEILTALIPVLDERPVWRTMFLNELAFKATAHENVVKLFAALQAARSTNEADIVARFVERMVTEGDVAAGWETYRLLDPHALRRSVRNSRFEGEGLQLPFDWRLTNDTGTTVQTYADGGRSGRLTYDVKPGGNTKLAEQLLVLPEGRYRLMTRGQELQGRPVSWHLVCAGPGSAELVRNKVGAGLTAVDFAVPGNCVAQTLRLTLSDSDIPSSGSILPLDLRPI